MAHNKLVKNLNIFYLAHPALAQEKIRKWELEFEKKYNVMLINPFYEGQVEEKELLEKMIKEGRHPKLTKEQCKIIVDNDLDLILKCNGTIAIITGDYSYGTIFEILHTYIFKKPVYIICTNGEENHAWLNFYATKIFKSFEEFEKWWKDNGS